jgi:cytochrome P450
MTAVESPLPPKFNPLDPQLIDDPYPVYRTLRDSAPLARAGPGYWVASRYEDVSSLLRDRRLGSEFPEEYDLPATVRERWGNARGMMVGVGPADSFRERLLLSRDPPQHTQLIKLMGRAFNPSLVPNLRERIAAIVDDLLDPGLESGRLDAVDELAMPLAATVLCELIGIPPDDQDELRPRTRALGRAFAFYLSEEERAAVDGTVVWMREYVGRLLAERKRAPRRDLLSAMIAAQGGDIEWLTYDDVVDNLLFVCFAGFETIVNLIAGGCQALTQHPELFARLKEDRAGVPAAVEEMIRYESPIQVTSRVVLEPVEIGGRVLRGGRMILLLLGSANHDERQFPDPERFDIDRSPNHHVGFGGGVHYCLGAPLGRVEAQVLLHRLLERARTIESAGEPVREKTPITRPRQSVPLALTAA